MLEKMEDPSIHYIYTLLRFSQLLGLNELYREAAQPYREKMFLERCDISASRPASGPDVKDVPVIAVHSITQYLDICQDLEKQHRDFNVVYRGQGKDHFLPTTNKLSLLPSFARAKAKASAVYSPLVLRAYLEYLGGARQEHIDFVATTEHHRALYREILESGEACPLPEARVLLQQPEARFLISLFPQFPDPYLFEAALQHYGFPTLTLDVTYSPLVALYFALHEFVKKGKHGLTVRPCGDGGVVYVVAVPKGSVTYTSPFGVAARPRIVNLFDLVNDNDTRPRRQYAAVLTEVGEWWADAQPHFNTYASYIRYRMLLSDQFWKAESTKLFIEERVGGWLFPGPEVDELLRALTEAAGDELPAYLLGHRQRVPHPDGRFEFARRRRVLITGGETKVARHWLAYTWPGRAEWLEETSVKRVKQIAADKTGSEPLDIVLICDRSKRTVYRLERKIQRSARNAGRVLVCIPCPVVPSPDALNRPMLFTLGDDVIYPVFSGNGNEATIEIQSRILEGLRTLVRRRYETTMKPASSDWQKSIKLLPNGLPRGVDRAPMSLSASLVWSPLRPLLPASRTLVLIIQDLKVSLPRSVTGECDHWIAWNLPVDQSCRDRYAANESAGELIMQASIGSSPGGREARYYFKAMLPTRKSAATVMPSDLARSWIISASGGNEQDASDQDPIWYRPGSCSFNVFVLNVRIGATITKRTELDAAMKGHIILHAELVAKCSDPETWRPDMLVEREATLTQVGRIINWIRGQRARFPDSPRIDKIVQALSPLEEMEANGDLGVASKVLDLVLAIWHKSTSP